MMQKLSENVLDKFSMDFLRNQVLKNAYGNDDTVIAVRDPRILLVWYLFFGLVPWFVNDLPFLLGCFLLVMVTTILAKVAGLVLLLFAVGVFSQTGYLLIATWIFGGNASAIARRRLSAPISCNMLCDTTRSKLLSAKVRSAASIWLKCTATSSASARAWA